MDILSKLFGSSARVRVTRLFLLNGDSCFETSDVARRAGIKPMSARKELAVLEKVGLIKSCIFFRDTKSASRRKRREKMKGWSLNYKFIHLDALENLFISAAPLSGVEISRKVSRAGNIKLLVTAGVFMKNKDSRVDLLVVGDKIRQSSLEYAIHSIEAELGTELRYVTFDTEQFKYRLNVYDRLVRDVFDYPHDIIVNRLGIFV